MTYKPIFVRRQWRRLALYLGAKGQEDQLGTESEESGDHKGGQSTTISGGRVSKRRCVQRGNFGSVK